MRSVALLLVIAACSGDECPGIPLEMREFRGEDVEGSDIWCDGEFYDRRWTQMCRGGGSSVSDMPTECEGTIIDVTIPSFVGFYPRLIFQDEDGVLTARGFVDDFSDVSPSTPRRPEMLLGAVAPQEHGENGRYRGRFEMLVELNGDRGNIRGTYDTSREDEGQSAGRSCGEGP